ncbi:LysR family transcriptional regulator [Oceanimonas baumannii]|uniref:DNA-binding transcriptional LysR family regulator n=1 Tax=Oceanimonas baumannii TaxID=129578 RepID=A0A235CM14_9GAMM|nr:LysR family transcriptional regulator [Oceanimonas baumannii]OYD25592.1 LysR family transcriptional regulator [Oceanimonas baumannii]TDW61196.1 DNA-binding transcriptional LysR family regulator [Oceanimonas baumannii]
MRAEWRQIRQFMAVAETLNFRRAAERLAIAQPALSRGIQQLEHQLGVRLFERNNRRVVLTEAGRVFRRGCGDLLVQLEETVVKTRKAGRGEAGSLSIGYTDFAITGVLPGLLERFRRRYPDIQIELHYGSTEEQRLALEEGKLDVAFLTSPFDNPDCGHQPVQQDRFVAVLPAEHPLAAREQVTVADLACEDFVVGVMSRWRHFRRHLDALCLKAGFEPRIVQEAYNSEGIFGLISARIGITILLECAANQLRTGLVLKPLTGTEERVVTEAAWRKADPNPMLVHFVAALNEQDECAGS